MHTPAHMFVGAALFAKAGRPAVTRAAILGGLLPDVPLILMVGWSLWVMRLPPGVVFDRLYFSDAWQAVFAIDHNLWLWGIGAALALALRAPVATAFTLSGLLHAVTDFLLHHDDARRQLWPVTDWVFQSPASYWDPAHYGRVVGPLELLLCAALAVVLWRRFAGKTARAWIILGLLAEAGPPILFTLFH